MKVSSVNLFDESKECEGDLLSFANNCTSWEFTKVHMNSLLLTLESCTSRDIDLIQSIVRKIQNLECSPQLNKSSEDILSEIEAKIDECKSHFTKEEKSLHKQMSLIAELETHFEDLSAQVRDLKLEESDLRSKINLYNHQAEEEVEKIDSMEFEQIEQVTRLQGTVTLMATATGIKWHYDEDNSDLITGEIDVPSKKVTRKFCFSDTDDGLEPTDSLWEMMMGDN